jgi:PhzF family phenazine biosynthesis protein
VSLRRVDAFVSGHELHLIDAFTDVAFAGNPAAVILLDGPRSDRWMQQLAREMNQAETAFLTRAQDGFELRWFTPAVEVDLCGHATLASAHYLWQQQLLQAGETARFQTRSGLLTATLQDGWITLDFPATPPVSCTPPGALLPGLGLSSATVLRSKFDYFVVLENPAVLRGLAPDFNRLAGLEVRGVIVTAPSDQPGVDFLSRFFAPAVGVNEDPVTGSAHCALAPYWCARLGRKQLLGYQISPRGGKVRVEDAGERVYLSGKAVTVLKAQLVNGAESST